MNEQVLGLVAAATEHDGVAPLSEQALIAVRKGRLGVVRQDGDRVVGYAHLDPAHDGEPAAGELVVHPAYRRRGHGRALAEALLATGPVRIWAHGDLPAAAALAGSLGLTRARALFQLKLDFPADLPPVTLPEGVRIRAFEPGRDEDAWLQVNARAFAHHPEQGAWTRADLLDREAEPWFDPAGFFLAQDADGKLLGFHWTKVHPDPVGEVYVVGVDPSAQGTGLGRVLTLAGLHHLRSLGLPAVMLYVDESNVSAVKLYESLGFARWAVDVMYAESVAP
jgi:mycothiol synthase